MADRVLLINPFYPISETPSPPLSLAYLAGALEAAGVTVRILDLVVIPQTPNTIADVLEEFRPDVVGATAGLLLECDEAQDVSPDKWDKDFVPMAASTHASTVFWGTAWTSDTLLAQQIVHLRALERRDGLRRVFVVPADRVALEVPAYGAHVADQVARLGRQHPIVKTQYYLETIDGQGGLFTAQRRALMRGDHARRHDPEPGHRYALLIDVAGEDESPG